MLLMVQDYRHKAFTGFQGLDSGWPTRVSDACRQLGNSDLELVCWECLGAKGKPKPPRHISATTPHHMSAYYAAVVSAFYALSWKAHKKDYQTLSCCWVSPCVFFFFQNKKPSQIATSLFLSPSFSGPQNHNYVFELMFISIQILFELCISPCFVWIYFLCDMS